MIKIYIINLRRSVERRNEIIKKMNACGLTYELFEAVDGITIPDETMHKIHSGKTFRKYYGKDMVRGEAGAAFSHLALYKKMVAETIDCAVILEDDIEFDSRLKHVVANEDKITTVLRKYDLILLGYCRNDLDYLKGGDCSYWGRLNLDEVIRIGAPLHWYWAAIGYIVSLEGAQKLLLQGDLPVMQADFLTAGSPLYNVRLGIIRNPIIWPGELNNISTIRGDDINQLNKVGVPVSPVSGKSKLKRGKRLYAKLKGSVKLIVLKLSPRRYSFARDMVIIKDD